MTKNINAKTVKTVKTALTSTKAVEARIVKTAKSRDEMLALIFALNHSTPAQREDTVWMGNLKLSLSKYADEARVRNAGWVKLYFPELIGLPAAQPINIEERLPETKPVEAKVEDKKPVETKKPAKAAKVEKKAEKALPEGYVLFGGHSVGCFITYAIGRAMSEKTSDAQSRVLVLRVAKYAHEILGIEFGEDVLKVTNAKAKAMAKQVMSQLMKDAAFVASVKACDKHVEKVKADEAVKAEVKIDIVCPKCGSTNVQRNGKGRGNVQRCFCKNCRKSFQFAK